MITPGTSVRFAHAGPPRAPADEAELPRVVVDAERRRQDQEAHREDERQEDGAGEPGADPSTTSIESETERRVQDERCRGRR